MYSIASRCLLSLLLFSGCAQNVRTLAASPVTASEETFPEDLYFTCDFWVSEPRKDFLVEWHDDQDIPTDACKKLVSEYKDERFRATATLGCNRANPWQRHLHLLIHDKRNKGYAATTHNFRVFDRDKDWPHLNMERERGIQLSLACDILRKKKGH